MARGSPHGRREAAGYWVLSGKPLLNLRSRTGREDEGIEKQAQHDLRKYEDPRGKAHVERSLGRMLRKALILKDSRTTKSKFTSYPFI